MSLAVHGQYGLRSRQRRGKKVHCWASRALLLPADYDPDELADGMSVSQLLTFQVLVEQFKSHVARSAPPEPEK